jgi:protein phosphatase 2C family protein 2/3
VLFSNGTVQALSEDHKPQLEAEKRRIISSGAFVSGNNRVNGVLACSRSLGDFMFKTNTLLGPEGWFICVLDLLEICLSAMYMSLFLN